VAVLRLELEYDGTGFAGFQVQPRARTVQGVVEEALAGLCGERVRIAAAGRTDAGCHARGQVVSARVEPRLPPERIAAALNARLPEDVRVRRAGLAPDSFHARFDARARRYSYRLLDVPSPRWRRCAWWPGRPPRGECLRRAAAPLTGEQDLSSFASAGSTPSSPVCRVSRAAWEPWEAGWRFEIVADHFLYRMVRAMVGTMVRAQAGPDPAAELARVIEARDRRRAGPTAPPQGLCLEQVYYDEEGTG
jgi:tRNA pseudouridine38-40 synthase